MKNLMRGNEGVSLSQKTLIALSIVDIVAFFAASGLLIFYYGFPFAIVSTFMVAVLILAIPFCLIFWFIGKKVTAFSSLLRRGFMVGAFLLPIPFFWVGIEVIVVSAFS